ncbi:MAG: S1 RNA-binding domain-containing protein, partial [Deltaproteobacteria bacterium]|nr:S1 RNA-binding domain-containing protein [Deltaproteobacteria bacterium]MBW2533829.1 S1 RNA-binding domain-containing protein [Deltaproteobacteria bacterium]
MSDKDERAGGFADLLAEYDQRESKAKGTRAPRVGSTVTGRVVALTSESVFVDLGAKSEGVIDRGELCDEDGKLTVAEGDTVQARVISVKDGTILLRKGAAKGGGAGAELAQAKQLRIPVEGMVSAVNKGGVEVTVATVRAFCPISQLDDHYVEDPASFVGRKLEFLVTDYQESRSGPNVVLSRRALLQEAKAKQAAETRAKLEVGAVLAGTISAIKPYGAFVDLGGVEGMLHVSELGFGRVSDPSELLSVGESLQVQVIKIEQTDDPKRPERIGLSLKALQQDPWADAPAAFPTGKRVKGPIVRLEPFGAFLAVGEGIEGLIHVSEMVADR